MQEYNSCFMSLTSQVSNSSFIDFSGFELKANSEDGGGGGLRFMLDPLGKTNIEGLIKLWNKKIIKFG